MAEVQEDSTRGGTCRLAGHPSSRSGDCPLFTGMGWYYRVNDLGSNAHLGRFFDLLNPSVCHKTNYASIHPCLIAQASRCC